MKAIAADDGSDGDWQNIDTSSEASQERGGMAGTDDAESDAADLVDGDRAQTGVMPPILGLADAKAYDTSSESSHDVDDMAGTDDESRDLAPDHRSETGITPPILGLEDAEAHWFEFVLLGCFLTSLGVSWWNPCGIPLALFSMIGLFYTTEPGISMALGFTPLDKSALPKLKALDPLLNRWSQFQTGFVPQCKHFFTCCRSMCAGSFCAFKDGLSAFCNILKDGCKSLCEFFRKRSAAMYPKLANGILFFSKAVRCGGINALKALKNGPSTVCGALCHGCNVLSRGCWALCDRVSKGLSICCNKFQNKCSTLYIALSRLASIVHRGLLLNAGAYLGKFLETISKFLLPLILVTTCLLCATLYIMWRQHTTIPIVVFATEARLLSWLHTWTTRLIPNANLQGIVARTPSLRLDARLSWAQSHSAMNVIILARAHESESIPARFKTGLEMLTEPGRKGFVLLRDGSCDLYLTLLGMAEDTAMQKQCMHQREVQNTSAFLLNCRMHLSF
jgi:hypothetical protein